MVLEPGQRQLHASIVAWINGGRTPQGLARLEGLDRYLNLAKGSCTHQLWLGSMAVARRRGWPGWRVKFGIRTWLKAVAGINCGLDQRQSLAAGAGQAGGLILVLEPGQRQLQASIVAWIIGSSTQQGLARLEG